MNRQSLALRRTLRRAAVAALVCAAPLAALPAHAQDYEATLKEMESAFGKVPGFMKQFPPAAMPGTWAAYKGLYGPNTAIPAKYKSLISLAVAAQIPCTFCVAMDTAGARQAGATDKEINEAIAVAAMTRHWSTIFYGMQVDLAQFKRDFAGEK
jgi:AhpD family alkylhydroperoxidase